MTNVERNEWTTRSEGEIPSNLLCTPQRVRAPLAVEVFLPGSSASVTSCVVLFLRSPRDATGILIEIFFLKSRKIKRKNGQRAFFPILK